MQVKYIMRRKPQGSPADAYETHEIVIVVDDEMFLELQALPVAHRAIGLSLLAKRMCFMSLLIGQVMNKQIAKDELVATDKQLIQVLGTELWQSIQQHLALAS